MADRSEGTYPAGQPSSHRLDVPLKLTTIDPYPVIAKPMTDYKTAQECPGYADNTTPEVKQQYFITTFDKGVSYSSILIHTHPIYVNVIALVANVYCFNHVDYK